VGCGLEVRGIVDRFLALEKDYLLCKVSSAALRITQPSVQWERGVPVLKRLTFEGDHLNLHLPHVRRNKINRADKHVKGIVFLFWTSTINSGLVFN
jgi:hypothetical protein